MAIFFVAVCDVRFPSTDRYGVHLIIMLSLQSLRYIVCGVTDVL